MMVPDTQPFDGHLDHEDNLFDRLFQVRDKADVDMHLVCPYFFERLRLVKEVYPTQLLSTGSSPEHAEGSRLILSSRPKGSS